MGLAAPADPLAGASDLVPHRSVRSVCDGGCRSGARRRHGGADAEERRVHRVGAVGFTLLSTMVIVGLFEEVGWRGFALPRMQRRLDAIWAALLLGVVWALWHLPELISDPTRQRPLLQFVVWTLALSVILSWLYNSTNGSLLIVIICHGAIDTAGRYMLPEFSNQGYQVVWWCMVGLYVVIAIIVVFVAGPKRLETRIPRFSAPG